MDDTPSLALDPSLAPVPTAAALVWGLGISGCPPTVTAPGFLQEVLERARAAGSDFVPAARKAAVRDMLRFCSYKPSGRSKPASEYLLAAALSGDFPLVNGPVDVNNAVSLAWGYPASVFDSSLCGAELCLRRGRQGESYQFNTSGQTIDLEDLLCVCRREAGEWVPCGNPVKDSMATKVNPGTTGVVAVIFAPVEDKDSGLRGAAGRYAELLSLHCGAARTGVSVVGP